MSIMYTESYLAHHGIKGQKWGIRRFQNEDGSYKPGAEGRYSGNGAGDNPKIKKNKNLVAKYKEYSDSYEKTSKYGDKTDEAWAKVYAARKKLGKTAIGRTINAIKGKSDEVKEYNKLFEKASAMSDKYDKMVAADREKYNALGKNRISRILNAIKASNLQKKVSDQYGIVESHKQKMPIGTKTDGYSKQWKPSGIKY